MGDGDEYVSKKKRRTGWDQGPSTVSENSSNPLASCIFILLRLCLNIKDFKFSINIM